MSGRPFLIATLFGGKREARRPEGERSERRNAGAKHRRERDQGENDGHYLVHGEFHRAVMTHAGKNAQASPKFPEDERIDICVTRELFLAKTALLPPEQLLDIAVRQLHETQRVECKVGGRNWVESGR